MGKPATNTNLVSVDASTNDDSFISKSIPAEVNEIDLYERREKIYTRSIEGFFQKVRLYTGWPLLLGFFVLPWLQWSGQPLVLFDLPARQFHILSLTIWPQDLSILGLILITGAFVLFAITTLAGRVWCGYTCPQTVWTAIFMWIEQSAEGTRNQRIQLDKQPWSLQKARKKLIKHMGWLGFATLTGTTFIGYFTPMPELVRDMLLLQPNLTAFSWVVFFTLATYINAGWAREQLCKYACPYARFQSVMFDPHTLIISYDAARGEPRGSRKRHLAEHDTQLGACIDCKLCVQVCPTGIDIRDGLQYECISCALCIDACNSVMEKMDYKTDLIRYTTEAALSHGNSFSVKAIFKRWKVLGYGIAITIFTSLLLYRLVSIEPLELTVIPDRLAVATTATHTANGNRYLVKVVNKQDKPLTATLSIETTSAIKLVAPQSIDIAASEVTMLPVRLIKTTTEVTAPVLPVRFILEVEDNMYAVDSRFIAGSR